MRHENVLLLIRHCETALNERHAYIGRTDEALSENGRMRAEEIRRRESPLLGKVGRVFCSPMKRCRETAEILFPKQTRNMVTVPEWAEIDFGSFEGKNYEELSGDPEYQSWIESGGTKCFPSGEDRDSFIRRSNEGLATVCRMIGIEGTVSRLNTEANIYAAVLHGGNIMAVMSTLFGGDFYDYQPKPGQIYIIRFSDGKVSCLRNIN